MKKIPTLFVRDFEHHHGRYVTRAVTPGCEWVLASEGVATRKWDGTCVRVAEDGSLWARREVRPGKNPPPIFLPIEWDETTGKTVGWEPAEQSSFAKFIAEAVAYVPPPGAGTFELVGPKVNGNPDGFPVHALVPHGGCPLADVPRDWDGLNEWTAAHPEVEGVVFWRDLGDPDAGMVKIKRRDFLRVGDV